MVAVANGTLLHDHQKELVLKLATQGYILGFESVAQMKERVVEMVNFVKNGPKKQYKRPEKCVMNQLVFG